jgi:predicted nuclease of restriction endonuclease-like (RecB) superfamily
MSSDLVLYGELLVEIKTRIRQGQTRAALSANAEMIAMYWDIGCLIQQRQGEEGWGAGVIPRMAVDIKNELPEIKGFSERNIGYMIRFAREYGMRSILQQPVAKLAGMDIRMEKVPRPVVQIPETEALPILQRLVAQIPWGHNILLMEKVKDLPARLWYVQQTIELGWSRGYAGGHDQKQGPSATGKSDQQLCRPPFLFAIGACPAIAQGPVYIRFSNH